jgi:hypothetical protein
VFSADLLDSCHSSKRGIRDKIRTKRSRMATNDANYTNLETTTLIGDHAITGLMSKKKIARQTAEENESAEAATPLIDRRKRHVDGIKKTIISSILGIASGAICCYSLTPQSSNFSYLILLLAFYIQKPIYIYLGMDANQFTWKDWFYIAFMTMILWFVSWTLLLTPCQIE